MTHIDPRHAYCCLICTAKNPCPVHPTDQQIEALRGSQPYDLQETNDA